MTATIHVGTILIADDSPVVSQILALEGETYLEKWNVVTSPSGTALDRSRSFAPPPNRKTSRSLPRPGKRNGIRRHGSYALKRILMKVMGQHFNCLEVTGITPKDCMGLSYTIVSVHSRHIQRGCQLDSIGQRQAASRDAEWARG